MTFTLPDSLRVEDRAKAAGFRTSQEFVEHLVRSANLPDESSDDDAHDLDGFFASVAAIGVKYGVEQVPDVERASLYPDSDR